MKSWLVHYMNKYPGGRIDRQERTLIVYCAGGRKRVQVEKDGADMWVDVSDQNGCFGRHDLAPIPKDCRAYKLYRDGKIGPAEEHDERLPQAKRFAASNDGAVPSLQELESGQMSAPRAAAPAMIEDRMAQAIPVESFVGESVAPAMAHAPIDG